MKKQFKFFLGFYVAFLIFGAACNSLIEDDCGPFPDKYNITSLDWDSSATNNPILFSDLEIKIHTVGDFFFSQRSSFNLFTPTYACSPIPAETDDLLLNLEITSGADYNPMYTQGTNLIDLFDVEVFYSREGNSETFSLVEFLSMDRKFPDRMILKLNTPPAANGDFSFVFKFTIDGAELDYFEFNTDAFQLQI